MILTVDRLRMSLVSCVIVNKTMRIVYNVGCRVIVTAARSMRASTVGVRPCINAMWSGEVPLLVG